MGNHSCEGIVITCIDFRFQQYINNWLSKNLEVGTFDRGAFAGAAKSLEAILAKVDVASRLHHIKKAVIINHEDCGAYGEEGTPAKHAEDLQKAASAVKKQVNDVEVETYYAKLDGTFEAIKQS
jgi:carbonic anhydrase